jgi:hypothetical protein
MTTKTTNPPRPTPGDDDPNDNELRRPPHLISVFAVDRHATTITYDAGPPRPPAFTFSHDKQTGLFILAWADGRIEMFRDRPARQLSVEADPETGEFWPVVKNGLPVFLYLCREEREL